MLDELLESVQSPQRRAVEDELVRLDAILADTWRNLIDLDRARIADRQGIGGPSVATGEVVDVPAIQATE